MKIADYFDKRLIHFLNLSTKEEVIQYLVDKVAAEKNLPDAGLFLNALVEREKIVSTGIGMSVAIPHAKLSSYSDFFIAIGILQKGVDWNALDGAPVRIVFLIGGPDDKQTEYLKILSALTTAIRDEYIRKKLLSSSSTEEILELFDSF